jgi:hypothetical protein
MEKCFGDVRYRGLNDVIRVPILLCVNTVKWRLIENSTPRLSTSKSLHVALPLINQSNACIISIANDAMMCYAANDLQVRHRELK